MNARSAHWGALLFTAVFGVTALLLLAKPLTAPLPVATPSSGTEDVDLVEPTDTRVPLPQELHSRWFTQTVPPVIAIGAIGDVTIQIRNVGHVPWIKGSPSEIRLGETGPRPLPTEMKVDWLLPDRPAAQSEAVVYEDHVATFSFKVAGVAPGTYRLGVRPVIDGVAWLEDEGIHVDIAVK
jgi:hypothetical protein